MAPKKPGNEWHGACFIKVEFSAHPSPRRKRRPELEPTQSLPHTHPPHPNARPRSPLSRKVSRKETVPFITITLSEPRGYEIIRRAFDVKHQDIDEESSLVDNVDIVANVQVVQDDQEERGRPRSKDEAINGLSVHIQESRAMPEGGTEEKGIRDASRGRKRVGLLDGLFGRGVVETARSTSCHQ
ncbi:hypothetical protein P7C73_g5465, partial [Tremellales sp. Uapishka_1]